MVTLVQRAFEEKRFLQTGKICQSEFAAFVRFES